MTPDDIPGAVDDPLLTLFVASFFKSAMHDLSLSTLYSCLPPGPVPVWYTRELLDEPLFTALPNAWEEVDPEAAPDVKFAVW